MNNHRESGIAILMFVIITIILAVMMVACRTKHTVSEANSTATLVQSNERRTSAAWSDTIAKLLSFGADSIVITFKSESYPIARQCLPPHNPEGIPQINPQGIPQINPHQISPSGMLLYHSNTPIRQKPSSLSPVAAGHQPASSSLSPVADRQLSATSSPSSYLSGIKIYAPHLTASSEEKSVGNTSSADSNGLAVQSASEEVNERKSAPSLPSLTDPSLNLVLIIIIIFVNSFIIYRNSPKKFK